MPRLRVAYARVSTADQSAAAQLEQLREVALARGQPLDLGIEEQASGAGDRPQLEQLERAARQGRIAQLWVVALDRLGRSTLDVLGRMARLEAAGCAVVALREGLDLSTPAGRLQAELLVAFATFERELIRERTRAGLAAARRRGARIGRPRATVDRDRLDQLVAAGASWRQIGRELGIGQGTVAGLLRNRGV
jgi:DNA invertase Pin-like site-specific DNA recombinase